MEPPVDEALRDAAIKRFEYTLEATWKAAQAFLREVHGVSVVSPKEAARASLQAGILGDEQTRYVLLMVDDRNLTVHTYNEELAEVLFARIAGHADALERWLAGMRDSFCA